MRPARSEAGDRAVATLLALFALLEIRTLAARARRSPEAGRDAVLARIRFLAVLAHNPPGVARSPRRPRPSRFEPVDRRDEAMRARLMSWTWNTTGDEGREWMLEHPARSAHHWTRRRHFRSPERTRPPGPRRCASAC